MHPGRTRLDQIQPLHTIHWQIDEPSITEPYESSKNIKDVVQEILVGIQMC